MSAGSGPAVILAGDIGGTKTVIGLFEETSEGVAVRHEVTYPSREQSSLEEVLAKFAAEVEVGQVRSGCFGVAGAVIDGHVSTTNLPWQLDEWSLARAIGAPRVKLLNDLEAAAFGMLFLSEDELVTLNPGSRPLGRGNVGVIAAGTGLGQAILHWDGAVHHPMASEGGHADFAPTSELEIDLLQFLRGRFGTHVSYERILSGPGIFNVYQFLRQRSGASEPDWLAERIASGDPAAAVGQAAVAGEDAVCLQALELFASIYGAEAGNLALRVMATGGIYVGGGIAPKILPVLQGHAFLDAFTDKGRFSDFAASIPIRIATNPRAPLVGAAHYALRL